MANEVQRVSTTVLLSTLESGTFTLQYPKSFYLDTGGATTGSVTVGFGNIGSGINVPVNSGADIQTALENAFSATGLITVTLVSGSLYLINFTPYFLAQDVLNPGYSDNAYCYPVSLSSDTSDGSGVTAPDPPSLTATIAYGASSATVQSALQGLSTIGSGNVAVADYNSGGVKGHTITFQGSLANTNVVGITIPSQDLKAKADTITVASVQSGAADAAVTPTITTTRNAISSTNVTATITDNGGNPQTFTLSLSEFATGGTAEVTTNEGGTSSGALGATNFAQPYIEDEQYWLGYIGNALNPNTLNTAVGNDGTKTILFTLTDNGHTVPSITSNSLTTTNLNVYQQDTITFSAVPTGGTYDLHYFNTSNTFNHNDSAGTIQTWIRANLPGGSSATVTGNTTTGFIITFNDGATYGTYSGTVDTYSSLQVTGQPQKKSYYLADSPIEGKYNITIVSTDYLTNYNDDAATIATATGWGTTGSGTSGDPFVLTAPTNAADVTVTAAEDAGNPMRKTVTLTITTVTEGSAPPTAPSAPSATALTSSSIRVAWTDNSSDETSFRVEQSPNGTTGWTTAGTTAANATSYDVTGLSASTTYYFRVFAVNGVGDSSATSNVNATTDAAAASTAKSSRTSLTIGVGI